MGKHIYSSVLYSSSMENIILETDSYKHSQHVLNPPDAKYMEAYFESRGGLYPYTVFFGLQALMKKYLAGQVVTQEKIDEAQEIIDLHMGPGIFNRNGWEYILDEYHGRLPLVIYAVPEGSKIPVSNVLMTVRNTDPNLPWLPSFVETLLSQLWYPCTVATQSQEIRKMMNWYAEDTQGDTAGVEFKLHDFGFRGVSSVESAGIGGAAHLLSFVGTDTIEAIMFLREYYGAKMPAFSIPASEHSNITSWGIEHEIDAMRNELKMYPKGIIACVSDSYDIFNACGKIWGEQLKAEVMNRDGTTIIRPDSGNPLEIVITCLETLGEKFGYSVNGKGYKVLDPHVRLIQGDGVDKEMINSILGAMKHARWSIENIAFGMGGALLQKLNRDTQKFAYKCSAVHINGEWRDVYKDPITAPFKRSKAGRLKLIQTSDGTYKTVRNDAGLGENVLKAIFVDGNIVKEYDLEDIRARVNQ
jgi:nicotinamide phosphoribosyltransferase